jgi:hypothetical protein
MQKQLCQKQLNLTIEKHQYFSHPNLLPFFTVLSGTASTTAFSWLSQLPEIQIQTDRSVLGES